MSSFHTSVLLQEATDYLAIKPGEKYIDATLGGGGHTREILKKGGEVLGIDVDQEAIEYVKNSKWESSSWLTNGKWKLARGNFKDIETIAKENGFGQVAGILFDLGVSTHQIMSDYRGFSFQANGPLDMRMDERLSVRAKDLVNALTKNELFELFTKLGEEYNPWKIINAILQARQIKPIETTEELRETIHAATGKRFTKIDPATKIFQALRIAVNDELENIRIALPKAQTLLKPGGRMVVISFHSLEDRIVKHIFLSFQEKNLGRVLTKKPVTPTIDEIKQNRKSRSAKLRAFEKKI